MIRDTIYNSVRFYHVNDLQYNFDFQNNDNISLKLLLELDLGNLGLIRAPTYPHAIGYRQVKMKLGSHVRMDKLMN